MCLVDSLDDKDGFVKFFFKLNDKDKSNGIDKSELKKFVNLMLELKQSDSRDDDKIENKNMNLEIDEIKNEISDLKEKLNKLESQFEDIDNLVEQVFSKYDLERKGYLDEKEFSKFYLDF